MRTKAKKATLRGINRLRQGVYIIRLQKKDPRTGLPVDIRRRAKCNTVAEAVQIQANLLGELEHGPGQSERVRLKTYAASWLTGRLPTLKPSTRKRYADDLERHILPDLGDYYLDALAPEDVLAWFKRKAAASAPATVNGYLRVLKTIMADAVAQHGLSRDPTRRIRAVPERRQTEMESDEPTNLLSAEEIGRFLAAMKRLWPEWYALTFTQFATARRFGEVSALRWEDIDEKLGVIKIRRAQWHGIVSTPKTDRVVTVPLTNELREVLQEWRRELVRTQNRHLHTGWVFPSKVGKLHVNYSCMRQAFVDCLQEIGVERRFTSHGLRRTANDLLRRIATGEVTRAIVGHATTAMTEHYSHVDRNEKKRAMEGVLRLVTGAGNTSQQAADQNRQLARQLPSETGNSEEAASLK
jgi:integrase